MVTYMHHERRFVDVQALRYRTAKKNKTRIFAVLILTCITGLNSDYVVLADVENSTLIKGQEKMFCLERILAL
jgi:hypothetical protein